jgi:hypothetical protein
LVNIQLPPTDAEQTAPEIEVDAEGLGRLIMDLDPFLARRIPPSGTIQIFYHKKVI